MEYLLQKYRNACYRNYPRHVIEYARKEIVTLFLSETGDIDALQPFRDSAAMQIAFNIRQYQPPEWLYVHAKLMALQRGSMAFEGLVLGFYVSVTVDRTKEELEAEILHMYAHMYIPLVCRVFKIESDDTHLRSVRALLAKRNRLTMFKNIMCIEDSFLMQKLIAYLQRDYDIAESAFMQAFLTLNRLSFDAGPKAILSKLPAETRDLGVSFVRSFCRRQLLLELFKKEGANIQALKAFKDSMNMQLVMHVKMRDVPYWVKLYMQLQLAQRVKAGEKYTKERVSVQAFGFTHEVFINLKRKTIDNFITQKRNFLKFEVHRVHFPALLQAFNIPPPVSKHDMARVRQRLEKITCISDSALFQMIMDQLDTFM